MKKIHTRMKRRWRLSTHLSHYFFFHPKKPQHRPKTFRTEQTAIEWAKSHSVEGFDLKRVKRGLRFQIVMKHGTNKNKNGEAIHT